MLPVPVAIFLGRLISILPFGLLIFLSRVGALFLIPFASSISRLKTISKAPLTLRESLAFRYKRCASKLEGHIWHFRKEIPVLDKIEVLQEEYLQECRKANRSILFVSIHHHSIRLFIFWLRQFDPTLRPFLIKPPPTIRLPLYTYFHEHHKRLFEERILYTGNDMRPAIRALQKGGNALILQDLCKKGADPIQFLGTSLPNPLGALWIAKKSNSLILPFITANQFNSLYSKKKWSIRFWPPIDPQKENGKDQLISSLEEIVRSHPETWEMWPLIPLPQRRT